MKADIGYATIQLKKVQRGDSVTNRERARIQTFPDDFEFTGKYSSVRKQIGMAVPPRGAEIIFRAILNTFAGIEYPYVEPSLS